MRQSLASVYTSAMQNQYGYPDDWSINWLIGAPRQLGMIGQFQLNEGYDSFNPHGLLSDYAPDLDLTTLDGPSSGERKVSVGESTVISFGANAKTAGFEWLTGGRVGMSASFGSEGGLQIWTDEAVVRTVRRPDEFKQALKSVDHRVVPVGTAAIVEVETARRGVVFGSYGTQGSIALSVRASAGSARLSMAHFVAGSSVERQQGGATYQPFPNGLTTAFRCVHLQTKGWFWWKHLVVAGVRPLKPVIQPVPLVLFDA